GDHEEGRLERKALAVDGDLRLLHRLEQRALGLGRGPVDLIGEEEMGEDRPLPELEAPLALVEEKGARDIAGQEVRRELYALEAQIERLREEARDERLGQPRIVLDQYVPIGENA